MSNVTSLRSTPLTTRTTIDQNSEQTGIEPIPPFIANQLSHGINVCDIECVCRICQLANRALSALYHQVEPDNQYSSNFDKPVLQAATHLMFA